VRREGYSKAVGRLAGIQTGLGRPPSKKEEWLGGWGVRLKEGPSDLWREKGYRGKKRVWTKGCSISPALGGWENGPGNLRSEKTALDQREEANKKKEKENYL